MYGACQIDVPYKGAWGIFIDEVLSPFYLFQIGTVILWIVDSSYAYSAIIFLMAAGSMTAEILTTRRNILNVRAMSAYQCNVNVLKNKEGNSLELKDEAEFVKMSSTELVPGDIIEILGGLKMPCDCVLLSGSAILNEAMLTGESIPVLKTALPFIEDIYNPDKDKKYTIYSGTDVLQGRQIGDIKVCALVVRTGFSTIKGSLVRYILYPKPSKFNFDSDSYKYIFGMFILSLLGISIQFTRVSDKFIISCLNLITVMVPPGLPAALFIGTYVALYRLREKGIYCISPPRISMAGKISVFCFDKTGTLTEEGLSVSGFRTASMKSENHSTFGRFYRSTEGFQPSDMYTNQKVYEEYAKKSKSLLVECIASCHSLTRVDGNIIGDSLDIEMFKSSEWILDEPEVGGDNPDEMISAFVMPNEQQKNYDWIRESSDSSKPYQIGIIKRFDFSSSLQRMSVIVKNLRTSKFRLYTKGSPEKIVELSKPESVPENYASILARYTQNGCRVIALATRALNINYHQCQKVGRELVEKKLTFLGLLVMQNKLKPATAGVISKLREASIRPVMVTGDNALTAVSVARECGIIPKDNMIYTSELVKEGTTTHLQWNHIEFMGDENEELPLVVEEVKESNIENPQRTHGVEVSNVAEYTPMDFSETLAAQLERSSRSMNKSNTSTLVKHQKTLISDSNIESEVEAKYPWDDLDEGYSLVFTGDTFNHMMKRDPKASKGSTKKILENSAVFARMSPDDKALLIDALQNQNILVGMCGDGANDCVALKAADVGISLSEAEASIAAPFTSKIPDISCVVKLLREGRSALATSLQCFKFMALYSIIQFTAISVLYFAEKSSLTNLEFIYIDVLMLSPLAITMSITKAAGKLSKEQPTSSLMCVPILASIIGEALIQIFFQVSF
jgi:cation-transporting ATPase 13A3/4/5